MKQILFLLILLSSLNSQAKLFQNSYISFELPQNWNCILKHTEWVCHDKHAKKKNRAVIILTAKEAGPSDSIALYTTHIKTPKFLALKSGKAHRSKVYKVKKWKISGNTWVDGLHYQSEVQSFYTRYLATVKNKLGILVTFSAHKQHYTKYTSDFMRAIKSLKVVAKKNILNRAAMNNIRPSHETLGSPINAAIPQEMLAQDLPDENGEGGTSTTTIILLIAFLAAVSGAYLFIKKS